MRAIDVAWEAIIEKYNIMGHNFENSPYPITARDIKKATTHFKKVVQREVRILCKLDKRESRPIIFQELGLFILPVKNGEYVILKGEGYIDILPPQESLRIHKSKLDFHLITSCVGNSEMQHLDYAYATSVIRTFMDDKSLVLTIRGRKYTPEFNFRVGNQKISVKGVQTEVDGGYEGKNQVVLIEAKNSSVKNSIIRQLYYPFRQWESHIAQSGSKKTVHTLFFENDGNDYSLWQFGFSDLHDYNSINLIRSCKYRIIED